MNSTSLYGGLVLDTADNVATLLFDCYGGDTIVLKGADSSMRTKEPVKTGHKIALSFINKGSDIVKYGQSIGVATSDIHPGEWVHIHNMQSVHDAGFRKRVKL